MTLNDINNYIIRHNLNKPSRKRESVYQRMYLYGVLYHCHKKTLMDIAKLFYKKDHVSIRHALIKAEYVQHYEEFIDATRVLMECYPFIIPPYENKVYSTTKKIRQSQSLKVTITLTKKKFVEFLESEDPNIVFEILWKQFTKSVRNAK
jgi:hypothetical protein